MTYNSSIIFEIYNLETSFTSEYVTGQKKIANVTILLMDFDYNVKHCLRNEITSKSTVIDEFGVDNIDDADLLFNMICTKIMFKYYLEDNNMRVCELHAILNDVYQSFINDVTSNKPKTKNLPPNCRLENNRRC